MFRRKTKRKLDLLEMSLHERTKLTREVRERLRERELESKLQQLLLDAETVTVDGTVVYNEYYLVAFPEKLDTLLYI